MSKQAILAEVRRRTQAAPATIDPRTGVPHNDAALLELRDKQRAEMIGILARPTIQARAVHNAIPSRTVKIPGTTDLETGRRSPTEEWEVPAEVREEDREDLELLDQRILTQTSQNNQRRENLVARGWTGLVLPWPSRRE